MAKIDIVHTAGPLMEHLHNALPASRRGLHADTAEALAHDVPRALKAQRRRGAGQGLQGQPRVPRG
jgi:UDP-N-acetylmuramoyl-tripeptide--D-alanyl-D-alanine ligase